MKLHKPRLADLTSEEREAEYERAYHAVAVFTWSWMQRKAEGAAKQQQVKQKKVAS